MTRHRIPACTDLGPDPEPCGQRFEVLLASARPATRAERKIAVEHPRPVIEVVDVDRSPVEELALV